jgi:uncharacterized protein (DUF488 family)
MAATLFTIGHSNHEMPQFLRLLREHQIDVLIDTRSHPYSKHSAQFNKDVLREAVTRGGIKYAFMGDALGGRPPAQDFYDEEGHVRYDRIAQTPAFREAVDRVIDGAKRSRLALLCSEEDPTHCHRRRLVGRVLLERGICVRHVRGDGSIQEESELPPDPGVASDAQLALFGEEPKAWRSTQSVLAKKPPSNIGQPNVPDGVSA